MAAVTRRGVTLSEAVQEAAAIAPITRAMLYAYELWHPSLSAPIRFVNDVQDLVAKLEATAPRDANQNVTFIACPLQLRRPEESDTAASPTVELARPDVGSILKTGLDEARGSTEPWILIERLYASDVLTAPALLPPMTFDVTSAELSAAAGKLTAKYDDEIEDPIPRLTFKASEYPGLGR